MIPVIRMSWSSTRVRKQNQFMRWWAKGPKEAVSIGLTTLHTRPCRLSNISKLYSTQGQMTFWQRWCKIITGIYALRFLDAVDTPIFTKKKIRRLRHQMKLVELSCNWNLHLICHHSLLSDFSDLRVIGSTLPLFRDFIWMNIIFKISEEQIKTFFICCTVPLSIKTSKVVVNMKRAERV